MKMSIIHPWIKNPRADQLVLKNHVSGQNTCVMLMSVILSNFARILAKNNVLF